jgi:hypothetical protein
VPELTDRLRIEYVRLDAIARAPRNPKRHHADSIATSITMQGFADAPVLDDRTGCLIAGHGRLDDLERRHTAGEPPPARIDVDTDGMWLVPVQRGYSSADADTAAAFVIGHNLIGANGGHDDALLAEMLTDLADVDPALVLAAGRDEESIEALLSSLESDRPRVESEGDDGWETITFRVPSEVKARLSAALDTFTGTVSERVAAMADRVLDTPS